jgi:hypothetical protein
MKIKTEELNNLFDEWETSYDPYKGKFTRDGINDEEKFNTLKKQGKAVLFIAKEPNDPEQRWGGDFRIWWEERLWGTFSIRIGQWAYGITNDFPPFEEAVKNALHGTHSIAFMNLKKIGGGSNANRSSIMKTVIETVDFLKKEISIIDPDIIIGGGLYQEAWPLLFGKLNWSFSNTGIWLSKWRKTKIISFYHPSNRLNKIDTYNLLRRVFHSDTYKNL